MKEKMMINIPVSEKYTLTVKEAASYFNIGEKKIRHLAVTNVGKASLMSGNRYLIIRPKFEKLLEGLETI